MILPYLVRLMCVSFASFLIAHCTLSVLMWLALPFAANQSNRMASHSGARLLFWLRGLPCGVALFAGGALCVPSYVRLEANVSGEPVGWPCIVLAVLGVAIWVRPVWRTTRSLTASRRFLRHSRATGKPVYLSGSAQPDWVVKRDSPLVVLAGVLHPALIVSHKVMEALQPRELEAALRHEQAHRRSHDNLKRFMLMLIPDVLPGWRGFAALERNWARLLEWAADDAAIRGDEEGSVHLAAALVGVARLSRLPGEIVPLASLLTSGGHDISARVERLLNERLVATSPGLKWLPGIAISAATVLLIVAPAAYPAMHELLERLMR